MRTKKKVRGMSLIRNFKIAASLANVGDPRGNTQLTLEEQASIGDTSTCSSGHSVLLPEEVILEYGTVV